MKKELLKERITISSKLKSMKYLIQNKECDCFEKNDCFYIPITDLNFFYTISKLLFVLGKKDLATIVATVTVFFILFFHNETVYKE